MGLPQIGLEAIYKDAGFQRGIQQFNDGISKATTNAERGASAISRIGSIASGALTVGIGAAVGAFGALTAASKIGLDATLAWGEGLDKLGDMFGMSGEKASAFQYLANKVGLSVDEMGFGLNTLTRGLQDSADAMKDPKAKATPFMQALQKLGVSAINSKGKLKSFDEILPQIMDAFKKLPPSINKSDLAMTLFGARGGSKFLDFLSAGSDGLTDATKKVKELGLELNTTQVNAIEDFGFAMNELKLGLTSVWNTIGIQVLPIARQFIDFVNTRILPAFAQLVREYAPKVIKALQVLGGLIDDIVSQGGDLGVFADDLRELTGIDIGGLVDAMRGLGSGISGAIDALRKGDFAGTINKIVTALDPLKTQFWNWLTGKGGALEQAGTQLGKIKDKIIDWIKDNAPAWGEVFASWKTQFWNWLTDKNSGVVATITENMAKLTENIKAWSEDPETRKGFQNIGKTVARTIISGIGDIFSTPSEGEALLTILARNIARALINLRTTFGNIGRDLAIGFISEVAKEFNSPEEANRIGQSIVDAMQNAANWIIKYGTIPAIMYELASHAWNEFIKAWTKLTFGWNPFSTTPTFSTGGGSGGGSAGGGSSYASGGFVPVTGRAFLHAGEYVLNRAQVMQLAPVLAGANNSRTFNFTHNWPASVPASERQWTEQMVRTVTHEEIASVLGNA